MAAVPALAEAVSAAAGPRAAAQAAAGADVCYQQINRCNISENV